MPPIYPLDCDVLQMHDVLGPASTAELSLSQLQNDALFPLAPLQQSDLILNSQGMDANGMQFGRDGRGAGGLPFSVRSGQAHALLDLGAFPISERQPLPSTSSRSLPDLPFRESLKLQQSTAKQSFTTKEIVREQNRRAAARFRQRQKVRHNPMIKDGSFACDGVNTGCVRCTMHLIQRLPFSLSPKLCLAALQDKLREYEKQIQELTARLNAVEKEKSTYELKCGEMERVRVTCHHATHRSLTDKHSYFFDHD